MHRASAVPKRRRIIHVGLWVDWKAILIEVRYEEQVHLLLDSRQVRQTDRGEGQLQARLAPPQGDVVLRGAQRGSVSIRILCPRICAVASAQKAHTEAQAGPTLMMGLVRYPRAARPC